MTILEDYCKVADALNCAPDAPVKQLVRKAEILWENRARQYKINMELLRVLNIVARRSKDCQHIARIAIAAAKSGDG